MNKTETTPEIFDALVVGGGPAGLQAALTLARVHRTVVLVDSGQPRNAAASHMHNIISLDGTPPAEFRAQGRRDLEAYDTVTLLEDTVTDLDRTDDGFVARTGSDAELRARRVVLATGVRDELPDVPGISDLWGRLVHHCPFCHGHELAGGQVGLLDGPNAGHLSKLLAPVADVVVVDEVVKATEEGGKLVAHLADGSTTVLDGLYVATTLVPAAPHADQLDLVRLPSGAVEVDLMGRTSDPRVFAAGDAAHHRDLPMPSGSVLAAAAAGQMAAAACLSSLIED